MQNRNYFWWKNKKNNHLMYVTFNMVDAYLERKRLETESPSFFTYVEQKYLPIRNSSSFIMIGDHLLFNES